MNQPVSTSHAQRKCPRCGASAQGAFCSSCGFAFSASACSECSAKLSAGARFCHRCGRAVDGSSTAAAAVNARPHSNDNLPWAVAAIALVALIALVAGQRFGPGRQAASNVPTGAVGMQRAPDISQLSTREITDRLFNRVMMLHEAGLDDSASFTAKTMAIPAFDMHDTLDADLRYHLGRIGEVTANVPLARAQSDTILSEEPNHLLGLVLASNLARKSGDTAALKNLNKRLLDAEKAELTMNRPEYAEHKPDIDRALAAARSGG